MVPKSSGNQVKMDKDQTQDILGHLNYSKFGVQLTCVQFVKIMIFTKEIGNILGTGKINDDNDK